MKRRLRLPVAIGILAVLLTGNAAAMTADGVPYTTYQYTYDGIAVASPHAYIPQDYVTAEDWGAGLLKEPTDLKTAADGRLYLSDSGNNRILVLNADLTLNRVIEQFDNGGQPDTFSNPTGLYPMKDGRLFVCDQDNQRILELDENDRLIRLIAKPAEELLPEDYNFSPSRIAVDNWGRIYVISEGTTYGIMEFSAEGVFRSFVGAQKVDLSPVEKLWRAIFTKEQIARSYVATPINYNNLAVDEEGFFYATSEHANVQMVASEIQSRSKSGDFLPVKKFNFNGDDILKRNGWFPPAGDISFPMTDPDGTAGPLWASTISAVALSENGSYFLMDSKRNKIFGYDSEGNLLYAFGGTGMGRGQFQLLTSIAYRDGDLFALDSLQGTITRFVRTEYGELVHDTIALAANREYDQVQAGWEAILRENNNFTLAWQGMGEAALRSGDNQAAMDYFERAGYLEGYSKAFVRWRKEAAGQYAWAILLAAAILIAMVIWLFRRANRFNKRPAPPRRRLGDHLVYAMHVIFHPFDGFWDIKHESRGSKAGATILLAAAALSLIVREMITGFQYNGGERSDPLVWLLVFAGVVTLFCVSNWCLTSLTDGKGSMGDIYVTVGYSVTPLVLMSIPIGALTNLLSINEAGFISVFTAIAFLWTGLLLFFGCMTTHEYSFGKNILSVILTLVGMLILLFIGFLLFNLFGRIASFVENIVAELSLR